jgi:hypothetical protein
MTRTSMIGRIWNTVRNRVRTSALLNRSAYRERDRDRAGGHPVSANPEDHLTAAVEWLVRAQDATPDAGVSRGYGVTWVPEFRSRGWQPSYPETTGYIIPTMYEVAARLRRPDLAARAIRMADWELDVQLESGAVQEGVIGRYASPAPAAFNTGQVLFGWIRAHQETGRSEYLAGARRAADYLLTAQGADGSFVRGRSAMSRRDCTTYYTRAAFGLCLLGKYAGERRYIDAAERNIRYAISRQLENGWFQDNCLSDPDRPLLHTIAYAIEGILGCGLLLGREEYIQAARITALAVAAQQRPDGGLSGRFASDWSPQVDWDCLTGDAQMGIVWWQLGDYLGDSGLRDRARRIGEFVMRTQNRTSNDPGLTGGVKGSFPIDGGYGRHQVLNWATKFFVDGLLLTAPAPSAPTSDPRPAKS